MTILDKIVLKKREEIAASRLHVPMSRLEESDLFGHSCYGLREFLFDPEKSGIIAEFKRASPSKGIINARADVSRVTQDYAAAGASAISVLTDTSFFGGKKRDLIEARNVNTIPILRKDFMLEEYQVVEAKALGADIILLIAAILQPQEIAKLAALAKLLGMSVLLEVHDKQELEHSLCENVDAVGVNNRNLADFSVSLDHSFALAELIPTQFLKISESGISDPTTIAELKKAGYNGFLMGENFMKTDDPGKAIRDFTANLD